MPDDSRLVPDPSGGAIALRLELDFPVSDLYRRSPYPTCSEDMREAHDGDVFLFVSGRLSSRLQT